MSSNKIKNAYENIADGYNAKIDHKPHNAYYDRPNTLSLLENVNGKSILDAACGPGKYAEILLSKGALVTGYDFSPTMIAHAQQRNINSGEFFVHNLSNPLTSINNNSFDIVLCALAMHYIENWDTTIQEFHRLLKPNGQLVISIEHPFFEYNYYNSKMYFDIELVNCVWTSFGKPEKIYSYRRSLQECITPITTNGFLIDRILEPLPSKEFKKLDPKHYKELREFPAFMCIRAIKK